MTDTQPAAPAAEVAPATPEAKPEAKPQKTAQDYIIARKDAQVAKANETALNYETKYNEAMEQVKKLKESTTEEKPENLIEQKFNNKFNEFQRRHDIDSFVAQNEDFAKYKDLATELSKEKGFQNLTTKAIFHAVAGDDLLEIGANRYKEQLAEGKQGSGETTTADPAAVNVDWANASEKDFNAMYNKMSRL